MPHSLRRLGPVLVLLAGLALGSAPVAAQISRDPNGVNVASQGATTVFITFGNLDQQVPVEASWCGALIPATPDRGFRCDPATLFGRLPIRYDQSRLAGSVFTDVMSIPPAVARRAYQAAVAGERSSFFYVRRFVSLRGGPDEYVFVTCRMAGGGARVPLALLDVELRFETGEVVAGVVRGERPPSAQARISYNGTGRLVGRWEVVLPGEEPPSSRELLTEATVPPEERALVRRFTEVGRFNVFLPPTGRVSLPGPDPERLPSAADGAYQLLLRIEASDDKEADSNLGLAGAGSGLVHAGAVAGFPLPVLRYFVGGSGMPAASARSGLALLAPEAGARLPAAGEPLVFSWTLAPEAVLYRLEVENAAGEPLPGAVLQQGIGSYRAPSFLAANAPGGLRWRVVALGPGGATVARTEWRRLEPSAPTP